MTNELMVRHCSPTLAGIKTGSLFTCPYECESQIKEDIRSLNKTLVAKGVRVLPLRYSDKNVLIYVFRPEKLKEDLQSSIAEKHLEKRGYSCEKCERCVKRLISRLCESKDFPHEIGFFLGYPPEDVQGFIEKGAKNCKMCGYWKVYTDEERAEKLFRSYRKCTEEYTELLGRGVSLETLVA